MNSKNYIYQNACSIWCSLTKNFSIDNTKFINICAITSEIIQDLAKVNFRLENHNYQVST